MQIKNIPNIKFRGTLNNKLLLKSLEAISNHSATFTAAASIGASMFLRPLAIKLTPNLKKENKQHSISNSIASGITKLALTAAISIPLENAVKTIEKNPDTFLKSASFDFIKDKNSFNFASQILKHSANIISAIPKSIMTITLIPLIVDKFFNNKTTKNQKSKEISFRGNLQNNFTKLVSKYFDNKSVQNFATKNQTASKNISRNMTILSDTLLTASFILNTKKSKQIKQERKPNLIYSSLISTGLSTIGGIVVDNMVQKQSGNLVNRFIEANKNDSKLAKYIQGINVLRPTLIFALIYYGFLPIISNYLAQRISNNQEK